MEGLTAAAELTPEAERLFIRDITAAAEAQSKEGDTFYVITHRWWQRWLDYVNQDMPSSGNNGYASHNYESMCTSSPKRPLAIDNSDLIYDATEEVSNVEIELHDTLLEGRDYILLPQEVWDKLYAWYGGGPVLPRKAISCSSQTDLSIEVYPLRLQLLLIPKEDRAIVRISKKETVGELHRKACEVFDLILDQVFIWDFYNHQKHALMNDLEKTLDDANIQMDQDGELALAFGELLNKLWAGGRTPISPRPFKTKLARFAPQFSGYNQHDSQELLAFLLDGLHEDLNRVKHKPYIKSKDADGRPDEEVADEYWANHIARNDSIIVDVCQGQYKSTLICPVCGKVSVTFDPFMYLSLPLQSASSRTMTIVVFNCDGNAQPTPYTVSVPKQGRCKDLIQSLSTACSLKIGENLLLAQIRCHMIHRFLEDPLILLSTIKDDDRLAAYRVPKPTKSTTLLHFVNRREEVDPGNSSSMVWKPFGTPLVAQIPHDGLVKSSEIHGIVHTMVTPLLISEELDSKDLSHASSATKSKAQAHQELSANVSCIESLENDSQKEESHSLRTVTTSPTLQLVDENNDCINLSTEEKSLRLSSILSSSASSSSSSSSIVIYIDWSEKDMKQYDTHYLENLPEVVKYSPVPKRARGEPLSLYACLDAFLREEPLVPEDMWYCPKCKERRQACKKLDLWRLPDVLVIHLKRFSFSRSTKHKLETFVNFPIHDFDLTNYVAHKSGSQQQLYELYALSNHYGSMASGHYTAHIKHLAENRWYSFEDSHISPLNEEDVKSAAAYVLFYRRVKGEDASPSNGVQSCPNQNHNFCRR